MALCHDERDFAMGFSRRDPHARRSLDLNEVREIRSREQYIASLTPKQKLAYERVKLCIRAIGQYNLALGAMLSISTTDLHEHFPDFARALGFKGPYYRKQEDGKCRAVEIAYPENKKEPSSWFITPRLAYNRAEEKLQKTVHSKRVRRAALKFCKAWLPNWPWVEAKLD